MWMKLGLALAGLGRLDEAASAYGKSVALRRELGRLNQAMEPLAGLARVALTREDLANVASHREIVGEWAAVAKRGSVGRIGNSPYTAV